MRVPENPGVCYEDLWAALVNDVPAAGCVPMLHTQVDPNCEPMDLAGPSAQRNTVVVDANGGTFDYYEMRCVS